MATNYHLTRKKISDKIVWSLEKEKSDISIINASTKEEARKLMMEYMDINYTPEEYKRSGKNASVKIHKEDGKFQEERTYPPHISDPQKTKG